MRLHFGVRSRQINCFRKRKPWPPQWRTEPLSPGLVQAPGPEIRRRESKPGLLMHAGRKTEAEMDGYAACVQHRYPRGATMTPPAR